MHEMALMSDILRLVEEDAANNGIKCIFGLELLVGEISNAMPDALMMAFEIFKVQNQNFIEEHAQLFIQIEKAEAECIICHKKYIPDHRISFCPVCDIPSGKIVSGESFQVLSYEGRDTC